MNVNTRGAWLVAAWLATLLTGCATSSPPPDFQALVAGPDRSEADRKNDVRRKPAQMLGFYEVRPGMRIADLGAIAGYNTELLARAVGPSGRVYAQNIPNYAARIDERMKKPVMQNVVHVVRELDDPLPPEAANLDLVTLNFFYHDTVTLGTDRARMNRAVFNALKPGGIYIVADHSGRPGTGATETKSLHRIEETVVRREIEAAGFRFIGEGGFLRNRDDPRDVQVQKSTVPNDEFVLKFVKP
ncbi:MAG TPA: methyltransferase domain-containing protein [Burkholderiales bacterium]|nr:methyltransferase domain-containing protein [Burkholderiales bacterium]